MDRIKKISVFGLGKLGLCIAACFADKNYKVTGVDIDKDKIDAINRGESPVQETALAQLIKKCKNNLTATNDYRKAVKNSDITFVVVATPSEADGAFSNKQLEEVLKQIAISLKDKRAYHLVAITSTVMPGTTEHVAKFILEDLSGKICGKDFGLAYNPEFIALGTVIHDFLNPDFVLIGETNKKDGDILRDLYKKIYENTPKIARMSTINAEIAKISLNCYITTKITFANSLAAICEQMPGANAEVITKVIGLDSRIGSKYFKPGLGYGGPCFPRDNVAFAAFARKVGQRAKLAEMVDEVNRDQALRIVVRIKELTKDIKKPRNKIKIGILGLSYKPNTPIIEDSQAVDITEYLVNEGYRIRVYDPMAMDYARGIFGDEVEYTKNVNDCLKGTDIGVIATSWDEFKDLSFEGINKNFIILDCGKVLKENQRINIKYLGTGY
ncbi:MAG: hypothetical protein A2166_02740 [Omnitrophica WOR_2 bacterium RBG_13_41_10]|nr:MAG: hypothetical protein A2166_02740 [Omnitrophica WOR_2 bacterium RBG_13_41_10]